MPVFYLFAALLLLQSLLSLRGGLRYLSYFRRELARPPADYAPRATLFVPCRGPDHDLDENLAALFRQGYPDYEIVFVSDSPDDPALARAGDVAARLTRDHSAVRRVRAVVAGPTRGRGQKVHNLLAAVRAADPASEVFVFVDTDARPRAEWLRSLVAPLADERVGAATGYRWFAASGAGFAAHLRSVWNASIASALGENDSRNFCWGGSTAVRRAAFERLDVPGEWRGALSDDFALTRAVRRAGLAIRFVPRCLTVSHGGCSFAELFEFTTRQLKITRVYAPHLWRVVLVSNLLFTLVFFGGLALVAARAAAGQSYAAPLALPAAIFAAGSAKSALRLRAVSLALGREAPRAAERLAHLSLWPVTSALFAWNALAAAASRRITWRGIRYELKSPAATVVLGRHDSDRPSPARAEGKPPSARPGDSE